MWRAIVRVLRGPRRELPGKKRQITTLAVLAVLFGLVDVAVSLSGPPTTGWAGPRAHLILQLAVDASLLLLWRFPRSVTALALLVTGAMFASDTYSPGLLVPLHPVTLTTMPTATPVIIVRIVRHQDRGTAIVAVGTFAVLASRLWAPSWDVAPLGLLGTVVPALAALYFDARQQLLQSLRDRAERAEREKHLLAEQARFEERRRLAAEMHDVVTHRLSLMILHAGALGVSSPDERVRDAAKEIRASGTQALNELRDLVGVLRGAPAGTAEDHGAGTSSANPPASDPAALVAESESVGIPVDLRVEGESSQISPTVARTAYRVVQEALTNVRKHAPGAQVCIELRYRPEGVSLVVDNSPPSKPPDPILAGRGSGAGLAGLRQRVELIGGSLDARPKTGGGYRISAILPAYVPTAESTRDDSFGSRR